MIVYITVKTTIVYARNALMNECSWGYCTFFLTSLAHYVASV
jgi:hypothetical protein